VCAQWGAVERPKTLGIQSYGPDVATLGLCPPTPNCISTAEEMNDPGHYVAPWTYNPQVRGHSRGAKTYSCVVFRGLGGILCVSFHSKMGV